MKVTTNIREYIKEEVAKILGAKENPYAKEAELDKQKIADFIETLKHNQRRMVEDFVAQNDIMEDGWHGIRDFVFNAQCPSFNSAVTPAMRLAKEWDEKHRAYTASKTREIIAKLELGANRQELDEMLAELLNEA